ncbi:MAG TPA: hypothetical protein VMV09_00210 [Candidatus Saccharimonadales bacterium]|nr:hypothetical protein [Candidatus Saccharimonadales bacterium]
MAVSPTRSERLDRARPKWRWLPMLVVPAIYATLACLAFYPVPPLAEHRLLTCACADSIDQAWFLAWMGHAFSAHVNPVFTTALNYPSGINVLGNVSMMALGAILSPISLTLGPVAAFNLAMRLALALSGTSLFLVLRWWRFSWGGAALAGLIYEFSPFMIGQATGHLHMAFAPIPPLVFFALERGLSAKWSPRRAGLTLGLLAVLEFFISIEVVTTLMVLCATVAAAGWLVDWHHLRSNLGRIGRLVGWTAVVAVPLLLGPALYLLKGPGSFTGTAQPVGVLDQYRADLMSVLVPTNLQRFGLASWKALGSGFAAGNGSENGEYLGVPMILALLAVAATCWRRKAVAVALITLGVTFVLTLGPSLIVGGQPTGWRLPFDLIAHVPFFQNQIPLRYSIYLQLIAATLAAFGLDRAWGRLKVWRSAGKLPQRRLLATVGQAALVLGCAAVLIPLVPALPYASAATNVPSFFTTSRVDELPPGTVVLAYPFPTFPVDSAMLWQVESGWRFRLIGGYAYRRNAEGKAALFPKVLQPAVVQAVWGDAQSGTGTRGLPAGVTPQEAASSLQQFCRRYHVGALLVGDSGAYPQTVRQIAQLAFPGKGQRFPGVEVFLLTR